jgi:5-methylcytosine-specific restriction endonuclease McrA
MHDHKAYNVEYRATHKKEIRLYNRNNLERSREYGKRNYANHREQALAKQTARNAQRREELRHYAKEYKVAHPEETRAAEKARRARKLNAPINDFTARQWQEMQAAYDNRCIYCGKRCKGHLTQDHITPLSKRGSHTRSNIVPACRPCNCKKGRRVAPKFIQPLLL